MVIEFDAAKDTKNRLKHGVSLGSIKDMVRVIGGPAKEVRGEARHYLMGQYRGRVYIAIYVMRQQAVRPISVRRASQRERRDYEERTRRG